ncbi:MAG TPA: DUF1573 domain-containing protein [Bacteroidales bacterium]|nr:DUF1573 domain-containing protein [Bacteroidales bacterium]
MKRCVTLITVFIFTLSVLAQNGDPAIQFNETKHDFGKFKEEAGLQEHSFEFVNTGSSDLLITRVVASCGCTSPEWTKSPVKPGEKGFVKVIFNPSNQRKFRKTVTVYSNAKPAVSVLIIEGDVIPRELTVDELYRWPVGDVRFNSNHLAFTDVVKGEKKVRVMEVINTSDKPVKIGFERVPAHLSLKAKPETLEPGEKGLIEGTYDGALKNDWGYVNDLVRVILNDEVQNNVYMVISANLTEDFNSLSKSELENAPVINFESTKFDFGEIAQNVKADVSFKFTNDGKSDLIIRKVRSSCGCTTVTPSNTTIKPGESSIIEAVFDAGIRQGNQQKVITIITNDPKQSQISLVVSGSVKAPGK